MSDLSAIMDALVTAAETVTDVTAERVLRYGEEIGAENFPFVCVYDPDEEVELGDFQLANRKTTVSVLLFTKDETQDALLTKMDAFRDAIEADRTLGGIVQFAHVASRSISEDNRPSATEPMRAGLMTVETIEQTGKIITLVIEVEATMTPGFVTWGNYDPLIEIFIDLHVGTGTRLDSGLRSDLDTIPVNNTRYQLAWTLTEHVEHGSNLNTFDAAFRVKVHYHMGPTANEETVIYGTLLPKIDGLLNPNNWSALSFIKDIRNDTPTLALDDLERVD